MGTGKLTTRTVLGLLLTGCLGLACRGPCVEVTSVREHQAAPGVVRVAAALHNSGGSGQVKVHVRLRDRRSGRTLTASREVDVEPRETVDAVIDVPAQPGDYMADVTAVYPPD